MPEFVHNEPSLVEARKKFLRGAKNIKRTAAARKATRDAKKPRPQKIVPGTRRAAVKQHVPAKKSWLTQPVKVRKIAPSAVSKAVGRAPVLPTSRISVAPLKTAGRISSTGGSYDGIDLIPVISSNVASIGYSSERQLLLVGFLDGSLYSYDDVPENVFRMFETAPSKGKFVWSNIRDQYNYQKVK